MSVWYDAAIAFFAAVGVTAVFWLITDAVKRAIGRGKAKEETYGRKRLLRRQRT